jgi:hypothetical protein
MDKTGITDIFLSHNWGKDELGRDNHDRVKRISQFLTGKGLVTWFDEDRMTGNIADKMTQGIEHTICVAVFVTKTYFDKVAQPDERDNCKFEFQYARKRCGAQRMIPVVMEPSMKDTRCWTGQAGATLGNLLCVDMSDEINDTNCEVLYTEILRMLSINKAHVIDREDIKSKSKFNHILCIPIVNAYIYTVKFSELKRDMSEDLKFLKDAYNSPVLLFDEDINTHMDRFVTGTRGWMHQVNNPFGSIFHQSYTFSIGNQRLVCGCWFK